MLSGSGGTAYRTPRIGAGPPHLEMTAGPIGLGSEPGGRPFPETGGPNNCRPGFSRSSALPERRVPVHSEDMGYIIGPSIRDGPSPAGWGARIRTWEWRNQNPLPYHLATPHRAECRETRAGGPYRRDAVGSTPGDPLEALQHLGGAAIKPPPRFCCRSVAQPGSAPRSGRGGRRFKSCHSDHHFQRLRRAVNESSMIGGRLREVHGFPDSACTLDEKPGDRAARAVFQGHDSDRPRRTRKIYWQDLERRQMRAELQQGPRHCQEKRSTGEKCEEQMNCACRRAFRREFHGMRAKPIPDERRHKCFWRRQEPGLICEVGKCDFAASQPFAPWPRHDN